MEGKQVQYGDGEWSRTIEPGRFAEITDNDVVEIAKKLTPEQIRLLAKVVWDEA